MWKKTKGETYVQYQNDDYVYEREFPRDTPAPILITIPLPTPIEPNEFPCITIEYTDGEDINLLARIYEGLQCHPRITDMSCCSSFPYRYVIHLPHDFDVRIIEPLVDEIIGYSHA